MSDNKEPLAPTTTKPAWQAPQVLDLAAPEVGQGICSSGTGEAIQCVVGSAATLMCFTGGLGI